MNFIKWIFYRDLNFYGKIRYIFHITQAKDFCVLVYFIKK